MKIYQLHIVKTEDSPNITPKTHLYKEEYGYYTSLENVKKAILEEIDIIEKDMEEFPEYIQNIYCHELETNVKYPEYISLFFNKKGNLVKRIHDIDNSPTGKYKLGDYVTTYHVNGVKVGVITHVPNNPKVDDGSYTIYFDDEHHHTHLPEDWIYPVVDVPIELEKELDKVTKKFLSNTEYQKLKRKNKLNRILNV